MSEVNNTTLLKELQDAFGPSLGQIEEPYGLLTVELDRKAIVPVLRHLYDHPVLRMRFLTDVCGVHFPEQTGKELCVVYHVHSLENNLRLRIKCYMPAEDPAIDTITSIWGAANWQERETFDFFGIRFVGHPKLKRILNAEEMDYHPMLKQYPLEDQTRTDKDDTYFGR